MALKQPLPFPNWRNKEGRLSAAPGSTGVPAQDLVSLENTKFPILLGTFRLELGEVSLDLVFSIMTLLTMPFWGVAARLHKRVALGKPDKPVIRAGAAFCLCDIAVGWTLCS